MPQGRQIIPDITVADNIRVALLGKSMNGSRSRASSSTTFRRCETSPSERAASSPADSSNSRSRGVVQEPKLLLLDEPTEGLQPSVVEEIQQMIKRLRRADLLGAARGAAPGFRQGHHAAIAILDTGHIVRQGNIEELTDDVIRTHLQV